MKPLHRRGWLTRFRFAFVLLAAAGVAPSRAAEHQVSLPQQAAGLFMQSCIRTLGHREQTEEFLTKAFGLQLPKVAAPELQRLQEGQPGGVGWWVPVRPLKAPALVEYNQAGWCSVRIVGVEGELIQREIRTLLDGLVQCCAMKYQTLQDQHLSWNGQPARFAHYSLMLPTVLVTHVTVSSTHSGAQPQLSIMNFVAPPPAG